MSAQSIHKLTIQSKLAMIKPSIKIGKRTISQDQQCYIIAEIGVNHNGSLDLAVELIKKAKLVGADAVKFQHYKTENLILPSASKADYQIKSTGEGSQFDMLKAFELRPEDFCILQQQCAEQEIDFIVTAFDSESLAEVIGWGVECLKWPSGEIDNFPLLKQAAKADIPILLSTGMSTLEEIEDAVAIIGNNNVCILQCVSNYPAALEVQNLRTIETFSQKFNCPTGFSDHTIGYAAAVAALPLGMCVLEKHFTLDRNAKGPDHMASTEPDQFKTLVQTIRAIEKGLGDGIKGVVDNEKGVKALARKSLVFSRKLLQGHIIDIRDITAMRPAMGLSPNNYMCIVGKTLLEDVDKNQLVEMKHVEEE